MILITIKRSLKINNIKFIYWKIWSKWLIKIMAIIVNFNRISIGNKLIGVRNWKNKLVIIKINLWSRSPHFKNNYIVKIKSFCKKIFKSKSSNKELYIKLKYKTN
jgi:hypothetical protein